MTVHDHEEAIELAVTKLGGSDVFIGHDWLKLHNPHIDWQEGTVVFDRCPDICGYTLHANRVDQDLEGNLEPQERLEEGDRLFFFDWEHYVRKCSYSLSRVRPDLSRSKPDFVKEFPDVFSEQEFDHLPERRPWDHAIELTPEFKPSDCKIYPLSRKEQEALDEFLEENLRTGRIKPSTSPMASPFFFIKKKNGQLRPVQDYRKLNAGTIKNKYPLPLIQELIDQTKQSKYFTKLDVR